MSSSSLAYQIGTIKPNLIYICIMDCQSDLNFDPNDKTLFDLSFAENLIPYNLWLTKLGMMMHFLN